MIVNDGPAPKGYYDSSGRWHFYDPEQAIARGELSGCVPCGEPLKGVRLRALRGTGMWAGTGGMVLAGVGTALLVGWAVWMFNTYPARR